MDTNKMLEFLKQRKAHPLPDKMSLFGRSDELVRLKDYLITNLQGVVFWDAFVVRETWMVPVGWVLMIWEFGDSLEKRIERYLIKVKD